MSWPVTRDVHGAVSELFPLTRDRVVVLGLVLLAAVVSLTELAATQLFAVLIVPQGDRSSGATAGLVLAFLLLFGGLRVINFLREMYRLNVFERALTDSGLNRATDAWRWAMAMEITSILSTVGRTAVIAVACLILAPPFGAAVVVAVALVGVCVSVIYERQLGRQRRFRAAQLAHAPVDNATKVRTRVMAGETGSLLAYCWVVLLIGLLLWMVLSDAVGTGTAFVLFIALRMLGQNLTELSKGLMRFVRARAFSEVPSPVGANDG